MKLSTFALAATGAAIVKAEDKLQAIPIGELAHHRLEHWNAQAAAAQAEVVTSTKKPTRPYTLTDELPTPLWDLGTIGGLVARTVDCTTATDKNGSCAVSLSFAR